MTNFHLLSQEHFSELKQRLVRRLSPDVENNNLIRYLFGIIERVSIIMVICTIVYYT